MHHVIMGFSKNSPDYSPNLPARLNLDEYGHFIKLPDAQARF
jgi:hypothetical protein